MRRIIACALMIAALLSLAACGSAGSSRGRAAFETFRARYSSLETVQLTAHVMADYGNSTFDCRLRYDMAGGEERVTVLEPEIISGISAISTEEGKKIVYDGAILDVGDLNDSGLTPVSALFVITDTWKNGIFSEASTVNYQGEDCWQVTFWAEETKEGNSVIQTLYFTKETCRPVLAEVFSDGERKISVEFIYQ